MLVTVEQALPAEAVSAVRTKLAAAGAAWVDGRATAGFQGAPVKFNQQIDERSEVALACQRIIVPALERNPIFISAILPNTIYPLMFNRYGEGMVFGDTVNTAARLQSIAVPGTVLVDDVTRRASEAAIAYEDAGTHQVKGRERRGPRHQETTMPKHLLHDEYTPQKLAGGRS